MTQIDPDAESITARLEQLATKPAGNKQPRRVSNESRLASLSVIFLTGLALGAAGLQVAASFPARANDTHLSDQTLDWHIYEIAENRDITPTLARRILEQRIETKIGAH